MKMTIVFCLAILINAGAFAQNQRQSNSAMDSLKRSVQQLGNLFKKAVPISVSVFGINAADRNLAPLLQQLQNLAGTKKIKTTYADTIIAIIVPYKGKGRDLWQSLPANTHLMFALVDAGDSMVTIRYQTGNNKLRAASSPAGVLSNNADSAKSRPLQPAQPLNPAAGLLFKDVTSRLSQLEKNKVVADMQFLLSKDKQTFYFLGAEAFPFSAFVYPNDMNGDGKEELFVLYGNSYTSGFTGSSIVLFIPNKSGQLEANLGFPGTLPTAFPTSNLGFPDLMIGGPGFEFPLWRWSGKTYKFYRKVQEKEYSKLKLKNMEEESAKYQATLE